MITGVMSGGVSNDYPIVVELYAISDVANLNIYNVGIDQNQNTNQNYHRYPIILFQMLPCQKDLIFMCIIAHLNLTTIFLII